MEIEEMFGGEEDKKTIAKISRMATAIAIESDMITRMGKELVTRKENLESAKEKLNYVLTESGKEGAKGLELANGLHPRATTIIKYFKAAGLDEEKLFEWLVSNNLGGIIKPTVHHGSLNTACKAFAGGGGVLPENIINVSHRASVTMGGITNFLKERENENHTV